MEEQHQDHKHGSKKLVYGVYLLLLIGAVYLIVYHGPHLYTFFPLIFFLLCPLMHLLHGHHHGSEDNKDSQNNQKPKCH